MFKFLHTADLHLGKIFHDQNLGEDQAAVLDALVRLLEEDSYAALVIAGDVYDRSIPSPQAVELFGGFLGRVKNLRPSPEVLVIPGNHDSAARLGFGRELFARLGIRFGVSAADCGKPVVVEQNGESCAFFLLPFLSPGVLEGKDPRGGGEAVPLHSQSALAEEAARRLEKARREWAEQKPGGAAYSVLAAHLFAAGGLGTGSERLFLGSAENVNPALFNGFDYVALGHLHRCQRAGEKAWYSGSPLEYSFGEAASPEQREKFFLSVELSGGKAEVKKIPVTPLRKVTSLSGPFARFAETPFTDDPELLAVKDDYLELRLTDRGITENARDILKKRFPRLLSLRQDEALAELASVMAARGRNFPGEADGVTRNEGQQDISADFGDFLLSLYGKADSGKIQLFNKLLAETEAGEPL